MVLLIIPALQAQVSVPRGRRTALLVGVGQYSLLPAVPPSRPNLRAMEAALRDSGFSQISSLPDCTMSEFQAARDVFLRGLKPEDTVVVYFSGYGVAASDEYYLLPKEFSPAKEISDQAILLSTLIQSLEERKLALAMVMLETSFRADAIAKFADANPVLPDPQLSAVWFSDQWTARGQVPTSEEISPFTREAVKSIEKLGSSPPSVFDDVRRALARSNQSPKSIGANGSGFVFRAMPVVAAPTVTIPNSLRPGELRVDRRGWQNYVWVPNGTFTMGCSEGDRTCETWETPRHPVKLEKGFWISETEVEVRSYKLFLNGTKLPPAPTSNKNWRFDDRPMVNVSWRDAQAFCEAVGGRLPTEAEWEYAARGGTTTVYPWGDEFDPKRVNADGKGNVLERDEGFTSVKSHQPTGIQWKLYGMLGNAAEWTADWYAPYTPEAMTDSKGPAQGSDRVVRGGSFSDTKHRVRTSARASMKPAPGTDVGFRCIVPAID